MSEATTGPGETTGRPAEPFEADGGDAAAIDAITDITVAADRSEISVSADCVTLINVFTVEAENQARLVELLTRATTEVISRQPGFISANLHASLDGTRVANYAQWAGVDDLEAMLVDPQCRAHLDECAELAAADAHVYRVSSVHHI